VKPSACTGGIAADAAELSFRKYGI